MAEQTPEVVYYRLTKRFWNGKVLVPAGEVYPFPKGAQPKGSIEVDEPELPEPELDLGDKNAGGAGTSPSAAKVKK